MPIAIAVLLSVSVLYVTGTASADPGSICVCPNCPQLHCGGTTHAIIQVRIFNGSFEVDLNNSILVGNQTLVVQAGVALPLKVYSGSCAGFTEWVANVGTIGSNTSCSTTFTANSNGDGVLEAIGNGTYLQAIGFYAGYIDAPTASTMAFNFTCVYGNASIPTSFSWPSGDNTGSNFLYVWVGIGGIDGNGSMWHAGIELAQTSGNSVEWRPTWEKYFLGGPGWQYPTTIFNTTLPSYMFAQVCTQKTGVDIYVLSFYSVSGGKNTYEGEVHNFYPNASTADWIAEPALVEGSFQGIPGFSPLEWYGISWADQRGTNYYLFDSFGDFELSDSGCGCGEQYATPTSISATSTSFDIDYSA